MDRRYFLSLLLVLFVVSGCTQRGDPDQSPDDQHLYEVEPISPIDMDFTFGG